MQTTNDLRDALELLVSAADVCADTFNTLMMDDEIEKARAALASPVSTGIAGDERTMFEAAYIAKFGDPSAVGLASGVELAWITGPGIMWRARAALAAVPAQPPTKYKLTDADREAMTKAAETGALHAVLPDAGLAFFNRGHGYGENADTSLDCPACGGSGHKDDAAKAVPAQPTQPQQVVYEVRGLLHSQGWCEVSKAQFDRLVGDGYEGRTLYAQPQQVEGAATTEYVDCPDCIGSSIRGEKRGVRCIKCGGTGRTLSPEPAKVGGVQATDLAKLKRHVCDLRNSHGMRSDEIGAWVRFADVEALFNPTGESK